MSSRKRVAILISGRGSNMEALVAAAAGDDYPAEIVGVIANTPKARGLESARMRGIATRVVPQRDHADRAAHDEAIGAALTELDAELVCLAGYMRILTPGFVAAWAGRLINIHPSLLPCFPGLDTHQRALDVGVKLHGATVHFVTEAMDDGPIIAQAAVPVLVGDTADALAARVLKAEHRLYAMALAMVARGQVRVEDGRAVFSTTSDWGAEDALYSPAPDAPAPAESLDLERLARFTP
ncbi:phosphoribosylglycinamide formyltransferase [Aquibium carbonis]|uniref:Phosphoribosylglycinamide formyltransferase n=1 Tax=Aquibium carbonis TaxID=2495581 RepID=A0A3R9ZLV0_9HYPH|nr:phosphoribosylglycinamide formyltransferase [Aquibium carbonis]RST82796.1 phosphoribosylglycinamide formyltransferase [Aquibium carbonis]